MHTCEKQKTGKPLMAGLRTELTNQTSALILFFLYVGYYSVNAWV